MLINIWSTPRTGSTWYSLFLYNQLKEKNSRTYLIRQYLNKFHFKNYTHPKFTDYIYEYQNGASYIDYKFDYLSKKIIRNTVCEKRIRNEEAEENYRLNLLESIDTNKNNFIFHNHIEPMNKNSYDILFKKADKNVFLYRENYVDQLSSYAIGYFMQNFHKSNNITNVFVEENVLRYLADRIILWHKLDKSNSEIVKYEDLPFDKLNYSNLPKKQNKTKSFDRLSKDTQTSVLKLNEVIKHSL